MQTRLAVLALSLAGIVLSDARPARAACDVDFDNAPAKGLITSMVRAFQPCPGSPYPSFPNTETEGGTLACTPVLPREFGGASTTYNYREEGRCQIKIASKLANDCAEIKGSDGNPLGLPAGPCHFSRVKAKCGDIEDAGGFLIEADDTGWTVRMILRASIEDGTNGAMTVIDLPVSFGFEAPEAGAMKLDGVFAEPLQDLGVFLPECTVLQISHLYIHDPLGNRFATVGGASVPEEP